LSSQLAFAICGVCLFLTGQARFCACKFSNLVAGKKITCWGFAPLLVPQEVIDHVSRLGKAEQQPQLLTFCGHHGHPIHIVKTPAGALSFEAIFHGERGETATVAGRAGRQLQS